MGVELGEYYWTARYKEHATGWDIGYVSTPLKTYFDQVRDKEISILIPGGGNSYEAEYLFNNGFKNVFVADIAIPPLVNLKARSPEFPSENLLHINFFDIQNQFDLIVEQTFFCALNPEFRKQYAEKVSELLKPYGKLVGVLFGVPLNTNHPPFGGSKEEYLAYFEPNFKVKVFETCYNSIPERAGNELFINLDKN